MNDEHNLFDDLRYVKDEVDRCLAFETVSINKYWAKRLQENISVEEFIEKLKMLRNGLLSQEEEQTMHIVEKISELKREYIVEYGWEPNILIVPLRIYVDELEPYIEEREKFIRKKDYFYFFGMEILISFDRENQFIRVAYAQ